MSLSIIVLQSQRGKGAYQAPPPPPRKGSTGRLFCCVPLEGQIRGGLGPC